MTYIKINHKEIYYSFRDHSSSQNLIFIHGAGGSESFWPLAFKKNPIANYYAVDLEGHGKSSGGGLSTIQAYAEFVESFINKLGLHSVILLGHSMGGAIALSLAIKKPTWLSQLVLMSTGARLKVHPILLEKLRTDFEGAVELVLQTIYGDRISPLLIKEARKYLLQFGSNKLLKDFTACNQFDLMNALDQVEVPTLILAGENDPVTPLKYSEYLHQKIKQSILKVVPNGNHMFFLEKPEEVKKELNDFLNPHRSSSIQK